jgi:DNA replication protein DnaC
MNCPFKERCNGVDCESGTCEKQYRLNNLFEKSLLTEEQRIPRTLYPDADQTDLAEFRRLAGIEQNITRFVREGYNLYLHSYGVGNGKTSWAIKLMSAYFYKIWPKTNFECQGLFISVPRYLLALKASITAVDPYADYINKNILKADIVIWDDIAAKVGTEFELNHLLSLINTRIDMGKCNIFTTNLGRIELTKALGERLGSRICNTSIDIEFKGSDKRYLTLSKNQKGAKA